jgi:hypothetical protein
MYCFFWSFFSRVFLLNGVSDQLIRNRTKRAFYVFFLAFLLLFTACKSSDSDSDRKLTIKGSFTTSRQSREGTLEKIFSFFIPSAYAMDSNDVTKVIVIFAGDPWNYTDDGFYVATVNSGAFQWMSSDEPLGLILPIVATNFWLSRPGRRHKLSTAKQTSGRHYGLRFQTFHPPIIRSAISHPRGNEIIRNDQEEELALTRRHVRHDL